MILLKGCQPIQPFDSSDLASLGGKHPTARLCGAGALRPHVDSPA